MRSQAIVAAVFAISFVIIPVASAGQLADSGRQKLVDENDLWGECVSAFSERFAKTTEPAEVVADSVMHECDIFRLAFFEAALPVYRSIQGSTEKVTVESAIKLTRGRQAFFRKEAIRIVLEKRTQ